MTQTPWWWDDVEVRAWLVSGACGCRACKQARKLLATSPIWRSFMPTDPTLAQISRTMTLDQPIGGDEAEALAKSAKAFARAIVRLCPDSRERSLAITNAEQSLMWAKTAAAQNGTAAASAAKPAAARRGTTKTRAATATRRATATGRSATKTRAATTRAATRA